jgi:hypothetical protein
MGRLACYSGFWKGIAMKQPKFYINITANTPNASVTSVSFYSLASYGSREEAYANTSIWFADVIGQFGQLKNIQISVEPMNF